MNFTIDIAEMVRFYDENHEARSHSSAIKLIAHEEFAIQLLLHYFKSQSKRAEALNGACTALEGKAWLDKWLEVEEGGQTIHYQVEIKSWSFHGFGGGKAIPLDCTEEELSKRMRKEFKACWDDQKRRFGAPGLDKVLREMNPNSRPKDETRPLACLWAPMHPDGKLDEPLFIVAGVDSPTFDKVWIFSASAYLRWLTREKGGYIDLELPKTGRRLDYLNRIYTRAVGRSTAEQEGTGA
jgi:hypothetical protein